MNGWRSGKLEKLAFVQFEKTCTGNALVSHQGRCSVR